MCARQHNKFMKIGNPDSKRNSKVDFLLANKVEMFQGPCVLSWLRKRNETVPARE